MVALTEQAYVVMEIRRCLAKRNHLRKFILNKDAQFTVMTIDAELEPLFDRLGDLSPDHWLLEERNGN